MRNLVTRLLRFTAALSLVLVIATLANAAVRVRGYTRKDGTYVRPHYRSSPDGNFSNNWSTKGNQNPYTGELGTRVTPPSGVRSTSRSYARNTPRTSARTAVRGNGIEFGDDVDDDQAVAPAPDSPEVRLALQEKEAEARLRRGKYFEETANYVRATQDYVSIVRRWPLTAAAAEARDNALRLRSNEPYRTWQSKTGGFSIVAKFVREDAKRVVLETEEPKAVRIDFVKLSSPDQVYVITRRSRL